jgi:hypothetical protein
MTRVAQFQAGILHRMVFELRYDSGELYWDRCGRAARKLASQKGWAVKSIDSNGCHILNEDQNLVFSYSPTQLALTQSQDKEVSDLLSYGEFGAVAEEFCEVVVQTLELNSFPRIGFREWTLYGTESIEDASARIGKMSFFSASKALNGLGELSYNSHSVVVARPDRMVRIAATPFEQQIHLAPSIIAAAREKSHKHSKEQRKVLIQQMKARKAIEHYPRVGVMLDLDAYIEEAPYPEQVTPLKFIEESKNEFQLICDAILSEEETNL